MGSRAGTQGLTLRVRSWWARRGCRPGPLTRRTGHAASPSPREGTWPTDCPTAVSRMRHGVPYASVSAPPFAHVPAGQATPSALSIEAMVHSKAIPLPWCLPTGLVMAVLCAGLIHAGQATATAAGLPVAPSPHPPGSVPPAPAVPASSTDLWSLRPVVASALPPVSRDGSAHLVDRFLDAAMAAKGLSPAPPAPRAAILRRLSFVLHGLPPLAGRHGSIRGR